MMTLESTCAVSPAVDAWARGFVERRDRHAGSLAAEFDRFLATQQVPLDAREAVRERAQELLLDLPFRAAPGAAARPSTSRVR